MAANVDDYNSGTHLQMGTTRREMSVNHAKHADACEVEGVAAPLA